MRGHMARGTGGHRMTDKLKDQAVAVAGAAGPVGSAVVRRLASAGAYVIAAGHSEAPLRRLVAEAIDAGGQATARAVDLADPSAVRGWADELTRAYGGIAGLVHLVGGYRGAPSFTQTDFDDADFLYTAIVKTLAHTTVAFHDVLAGNPGSRFAMVSAVGAHRPTAGNAAYAAAKAAAEAWTLALAHSFSAPDTQQDSGPAATILVIKAVVTEQMRRERPDANFEGFTAPEELADVIAGLWDWPAEEINGTRLWLTDRPNALDAIDRQL
jgi:NAD(P)-dependent dehydrogenase (short-subunit alcohol dehydrogenase family)